MKIYLKKLNMSIPKDVYDKLVKEELIHSRLTEAKREGEVAYVTGDKEYARSNAIAGDEWKIMLANRLYKLKFAEVYERINEVSAVRQALLERLKKSDAEFRLVAGVDPKEANRVYKQGQKIEKEFNELGKVLNHLYDERNRLQTGHQLVDRRVYLFKIEIPKSELLSLLHPKSKYPDGKFYIYDTLLVRGIPRKYIKSMESAYAYTW
jgi:hypothetical protein